jgi:hypothetical protein
MPLIDLPILPAPDDSTPSAAAIPARVAVAFENVVVQNDFRGIVAEIIKR